MHTKNKRQINIICIIIIIFLLVINYFILFYDTTQRPYIIPPGTMDDVASHVFFINNIIDSQKYTPLDNYLYPPGFHMLIAAVTLITALDPLSFLKWAYLCIPILSLLAVFIFVRKHLNLFTALFLLFTYGMISKFPLSNIYDGTFVSVISINILIVMSFTYLLTYQKTKEPKYILIFLIFSFASIIYSAIAFFYLLPLVLATFLVMLLITLFNKQKTDKFKILILIFVPLLILIFAKIMLGDIYFDMYFNRLINIIVSFFSIIGIHLNSQTTIVELTEQVNPQLPSIGSLYKYSGYEIFYLGIGGLILLLFQKKIKNFTKLFLILWFFIILIFSLSNIFILPERFARELAVPLSILAAFLLYEVYILIKKNKYYGMSFLIIITIFSLSNHIFQYGNFLKSKARIENIDLTAIEWIGKNVPSNVRILSSPYTSFASAIDKDHKYCSGLGFASKKIPENNDIGQYCDFILTYPKNSKNKKLFRNGEIKYVYSVNVINNWTDPRTNWLYFNDFKKLDYLIPIKTFSNNGRKIIIYEVDYQKI